MQVAGYRLQVNDATEGIKLSCKEKVIGNFGIMKSAESNIVKEKATIVKPFPGKLPKGTIMVNKHSYAKIVESSIKGRRKYDK